MTDTDLRPEESRAARWRPTSRTVFFGLLLVVLIGYTEMAFELEWRTQAGRIGPGFASVLQRITATADGIGIDKRVLDLDSAGGQIEEAIRAGDFIAESRWTIWVREDSICHTLSRP